VFYHAVDVCGVRPSMPSKHEQFIQLLKFRVNSNDSAKRLSVLQHLLA